MRLSEDFSDRTYRRGMVMGLTLAEVMLLVLFALLLVLGWVVQRNDENQELAEAMRPLLPQDVVDTSVFDDVIRELTEAVRLGRVVSMMAADGSIGLEIASEELSERTAELLALGAQAESALGQNSSGMPANFAAQEALIAAGSEYRETRESQGHGSARIWLEWLAQNQPQGNGGNGLVFPSCVPSVDGTTQYIYDVTLGSAGILVVDNALPEMQQWAAEAADVVFERAVSQATFAAMTQALFDWSVQNQCRFFVRVYDATAPFEKGLYKDELQTVESHFYKFLADVAIN